MPSPLPRLVRLATALAVLLVLPACGGGETGGVPAGTDWVVEPDADTTGATALLGTFADGTVPAAFDRLAGRPYRLNVITVDLVPGSGSENASAFEPAPDGATPPADTLGWFRQVLEVRPGAAPRVVSTGARGSLADSAGLDVSRLLPRDPLPAIVSDEPPFLDPRTRGAYRIQTVGVPSAGFSASVAVVEEDADRPLVRNANATRQPDGSRTLGSLRISRSAIYDESSAAVVGLAPSPSGEVPQFASVRTETKTPLRHRLLTTSWRMTMLDPVAAQPDTTNTREP